MRILYHHRTRAEDAQGVHIREMVKAFRDLGHEVHLVGLVGSEGDRPASRLGRVISVSTKHMPFWLYELLEILYNLPALPMLAWKVWKFKPDCIYERYSLYGLAGVLASKITDKPLILEVNAPLAMEKKQYARILLGPVAEWIESFVCRKATRTIAVSTPLKRILQGNGVLGEQIEVIPNGVDPERFHPEVDGTRVRERLGLLDRTVVGFVGWMRQWHGLEQLLETYIRHAMRDMGIAILLVGDGPAMPELKGLAAREGLVNDGVFFAGSVDSEEIPEHIAAFDLALQPDVTGYACPIKTVEYIAMGRGVIAPDKPNILELLELGYPGLFPAGDWEAMARIILQNAASEDRLEALRERTLAIRELRNYSWRENALETLSLLPGSLAERYSRTLRSERKSEAVE